METEIRRLSTELDTQAFSAEVAEKLVIGSTLLLSGPLGVGKTTFVRGLLFALGHIGIVKSPTFQLLAMYDLDCGRVVHADLYRLTTAAGLGLEEYFGEATCLIEWPDRLPPDLVPQDAWKLDFEFQADGERVATWTRPKRIGRHTE